MAVHQSIRGSELLLDIDRSSGTPLHGQLENALRAAVRSGRLAAGTRLPATRVLASELGCSRWVVVEAYLQLGAEGYLRARAGGGTVVAVQPVPAPAPVRRRPPAVPPSPVVIDFEPGLPDLAAFPRSTWLRALQQTVRGFPSSGLDYGQAAGAASLRQALAGYLARARGGGGEADDIVGCSRVTHGLTLLCEVLRRHGHRSIAVEDPGWPQLRNAVRRAGLDPLSVPVDGEGILVAALQRLPARAVLVTPAHQFPRGVVLSAARRAALLAWARDRDAVILEDDYDAEYRYDRRPVGALQGLDPPRVAYLGSVSKTLGPGVRLGWAVPPAPLLAAVLQLRACGDPPPATLDQLTLAQLIETGALDRHLRRTRATYLTRRNALRASLAEHLPGATAEGVEAGLHLLVRLPADADEAALVAAARRLGVHVAGLAGYHHELDAGGPGLVIGYGKAPEHQIAGGVARLAAAYHATRTADPSADRPPTVLAGPRRQSLGGPLAG
jgi:GntR family transcriptional regulator / MocR family aminotransferase